MDDCKQGQYKGLEGAPDCEQENPPTKSSYTTCIPLLPTQNRLCASARCSVADDNLFLSSLIEFLRTSDCVKCVGKSIERDVTPPHHYGDVGVFLVF